tara:strand:+ start:882 stop:1127 length:246 start_codon:yes stop_codon:yes gene_type:complete
MANRKLKPIKTYQRGMYCVVNHLPDATVYRIEGPAEAKGWYRLTYMANASRRVGGGDMCEGAMFVPSDDQLGNSHLIGGDD